MSLEAWALAALQKQPVYYEDVGSPEKAEQLQMVAQAVTQAAREQKGWPLSKQMLIAAELAVEENESHGSLRIHRGECNLKKGECDGGRATSLFQLHANALSSPAIWPRLGFMTIEATTLSAKEASRILVRSYLYCASTGLPEDRIAMMFVGFAGRGCKLDQWQGWHARVDAYRRALRVPVPRSGDAPSQKQPAG